MPVNFNYWVVVEPLTEFKLDEWRDIFSKSVATIQLKPLQQVAIKKIDATFLEIKPTLHKMCKNTGFH